eukprot:3972217-Pleurochrysis_carterae.AAC.3
MHAAAQPPLPRTHRLNRPARRRGEAGEQRVVRVGARRRRAVLRFRHLGVDLERSTCVALAHEAAKHNVVARRVGRHAVWPLAQRGEKLTRLRSVGCARRRRQHSIPRAHVRRRAGPARRTAERLVQQRDALRRAAVHVAKRRVEQERVECVLRGQHRATAKPGVGAQPEPRVAPFCRRRADERIE